MLENSKLQVCTKKQAGKIGKCQMVLLGSLLLRKKRMKPAGCLSIRFTAPKGLTRHADCFQDEFPHLRHLCQLSNCGICHALKPLRHLLPSAWGLEPVTSEASILPMGLSMDCSPFILDGIHSLKLKIDHPE